MLHRMKWLELAPVSSQVSSCCVERYVNVLVQYKSPFAPFPGTRCVDSNDATYAIDIQTSNPSSL